MTSPLENLLGVKPSDENLDATENEQVEVEEEDEEEETPEDLRSEGQKALDRMKAEKKAMRAELRKMKQELEALKTGKDEDDIRTSVRKEVAREFGLELAKEKARLMLSEAGYKGNLDRGIRALERDLKDTIGDDGKVDREALADLVSDWKEDEPSLFRRSRNVADDDEDDAPTQRRSTGSSDLGKKRAPRTQKDPLEKALEELVGRNRLA